MRFVFSPPADEANALQSLVSRLRRALGAGELIQQAPGGYRLAVEAADIDVQRFGTLARRSSTSTPRPT